LAAQSTYQLPPNQPEQDACNALQLCGGVFFTPYSYTGTGRKLDLDETPCLSGPGGGENNSVWLQIRVATAGDILFTLTPVDPQDDYNFAVLNVTGKSCDALTAREVVKCNYNNNIPGSNVNGAIGLSDTSRTPYILDGVFGYSFNEAIHSKSEQVYLILINNLGNYVNGGPSKGFTIDFAGSTATFYNTASPQLTSLDVPCNNAKSIVVKTNTEILCSSIAADGSDFTTNAPASIISASGFNCTNKGSGYTNSIVINFSSVLPPGNYILNVKKGSDNNSLKGLCNDDLALPPNGVPFIVKLNAKAAIDNEVICFQQLPYTWNGIQVNNEGDNIASYTTTSSEGCDSTAILNLHVLQAPQQISQSKSICDGDFYVLPWDSAVTTAGTYTHHYTNVNGCDSVIESIAVNVFVPSSGDVQARDSTIETGFCQGGSSFLRPDNNFVSYLWNTGETSSSITVNVAGTYDLIAQDKDGCITIDTFVVARYEYPTPTFRSVENLCAGDQKVLDAGVNSTYYLWNNGSSSQTITTDKPGKFWVAMNTAHNCMAVDTVTVVMVQPPGDFLNSSVSKCSYEHVTLSPSKSFFLYSWSNGSTSKSINVSTTGLYWLDVTDNNGCKARDSITVVDAHCPEYFFIPTAFTPNNDAHNDVFKPTFAGPIAGYQFSIYNRWGKLIFSTKDPYTGWNGTLGGVQQPTGVYIWMCSYSLDGHPLKTEKGTVTLIR
jgi:gliding motility-associated-like protein